MKKARRLLDQETTGLGRRGTTLVDLQDAEAPRKDPLEPGITVGSSGWLTSDAACRASGTIGVRLPRSSGEFGKSECRVAPFRGSL